MKMPNQERFFVYGQKEVHILFCLILLLLAFAFTLGVHLGKQVGIRKGASPEGAVSAPSHDQKVEPSLRESLSQTLYDEVIRLGIKADPTITPSPAAEIPLVTQAAHRPFPPGSFTLEVGASASLQEILSQLKALEGVGLKPILKPLVSASNQKVFRIYLGGFPNQQQAEATGEKYRDQHWIDSYLVTRINQTE